MKTVKDARLPRPITPSEAITNNKLKFEAAVQRFVEQANAQLAKYTGEPLILDPVVFGSTADVQVAVMQRFTAVGWKFTIINGDNGTTVKTWH